MLTQLLCSAALLAAPPAVEDDEPETPTPFEKFAAVLRGQSPGPTFGESASSSQIYSDPFVYNTAPPGAWGGPAGAPFAPGYFSGLAPLTEYGTRFGLRHHVGEGVSHDDSFTTFELFQPVFQGYSDMWFLDGRFILENDSDTGFNIGGGYRYYDPFMDRLWGASVWFDYDDTHASEFHQLGVSLESLGYWLDGRVNVYIPLGDTEETLGFSDPSTRFDGGSSILIDAIRRDQVALTGVDLEVGTAVPGLDPNVRVYGGYYHFGSDAAGAPDINGVKGRVEGWVNPNLQLQLEVTHDDTFDTNVLFTVALLFGGSSVPHRGGALPNYGIIRGQTPAPGYIAGPERLYDTVQRNYHVVVADAFVPETLVAINPRTGLPWNVVHVDSNAAAGGDGTRNDPFMTLADAEAGSSKNDLVFAHAGSVFVDESFTMQSGQRLLGEGVDHYFDDIRFTNLLLPRANTDVDFKPLIHGDFGGADAAAILVASNTEVSNFTIVSTSMGEPGQDGIKNTAPFGGDVNINRTEISLVDRAIELTDVGDVSLSKNIVTKYGQDNDEGILVTGGTGNTKLSYNTVIDADDGDLDDPITVTDRIGDVRLSYNTALTGEDGILVDSITGDVRFEHNTVQDIRFGSGIEVSSVSGDLSFYGDVVQDVLADGINVEDVGDDVSLTKVTVTDTMFGDGIDIDDVGGDVVFDRLTVMNAAATGVQVGNDASIGGDVRFLSYNHISASGDDGLFVDDVGGDVRVNDLYLADSGENGAVIGADVGVGGDVSVTNSQISRSLNANGLFIDQVGDDVLVKNTFVGESFEHGIRIGETFIDGSVLVSHSQVSQTGIAAGPGFDGIFVSEVGGDVTVEYTDVSEAGNHGIHASTVAGDVTVKHNNISDADNENLGVGDGIFIESVEGNALAGYNVVDSTGGTHEDGIRFQDITGNATATYNVVNNSEDDGIEFDSVEGSVVASYNAVSNSAEDGIRLDDVAATSGKNASILYNVITQSGDDAIEVEEMFGTDLLVKYNKISVSGDRGINLATDIDIDGVLDVSRNVVVNSQENAIFVDLDGDFAGRGVFDQNVVTEFGLEDDGGAGVVSGIFVENSADGRSFAFTGNLITDNLDNDIADGDPTTGDEEYGIFYNNVAGDNDVTIAGNRMFWDDPDNTVGVRLEAPAGSITLVPLSPPLAAQESNTTNAELEYSDDGGTIIDSLLVNGTLFP